MKKTVVTAFILALSIPAWGGLTELDEPLVSQWESRGIKIDRATARLVMPPKELTELVVRSQTGRDALRTTDVEERYRVLRALSESGTSLMAIGGPWIRPAIFDASCGSLSMKAMRTGLNLAFASSARPDGGALALTLHYMLKVVADEAQIDPMLDNLRKAATELYRPREGADRVEAFNLILYSVGRNDQITNTSRFAQFMGGALQAGSANARRIGTQHFYRLEMVSRDTPTLRRLSFEKGIDNLDAIKDLKTDFGTVPLTVQIFALP